MHEVKSSDTSHADIHLPFYAYKNLDEFTLPKECVAGGRRIARRGPDLPSFRHPMRAAYVLGPEKGSLSPALVKRCDFVVKIPAKFCVNVGVAGRS